MLEQCYTDFTIMIIMVQCSGSRCLAEEGPGSDARRS